MQCDYFDAGLCRSCTWMGRPYAEQLAGTQAACERALAGQRDLRWSPPAASRDSAFRSKAKMVVAGTVEAPTLGILDEHRRGTDLRRCGLLRPALAEAMPALAELVARARLTPYDVPSRRGELKHLIVQEGVGGAIMVRAVLRSTEAVPRLRRHLPWLLERLPGLLVVSVNLQPEHKAVLEGEHEDVLTPATTLPVAVGDVVLHLRPQGFVQTNLEVAGELYRQARTWVDEVAPRDVWDLYCGAGGFTLHLAAPGRTVLGVEVSTQSVDAAVRSRQELGLPAEGPGAVGFVAADATTWVREADPGPAPDRAPDLVVVNPPRRGIGDDLAGWLEVCTARHVLYSSCDVRSLARDLAAMPSWRAVRGRVLDMFPQTAHAEVLLLLSR